jgi:hypothetical protein
MSVVHRVRLPVGATPMVEPGHPVEPAEVLATRRPPGPGTTLPIAARLRRSAEDAAACLLVAPGTTVDAGEVLARDGSREVRAPEASLYLGYDRDDGSALLAPLLGTEPILGHVRGEVTDVRPDAIEVRVNGALLGGVGGSGTAVHGELRVAVHEPAEELRASAIDVEATGRILVGGSRASAETLTRARAMGVAGIVLGGILDKELRDFEATQRRRRQVGAAEGSFAVLLLEGYGRSESTRHCSPGSARTRDAWPASSAIRRGCTSTMPIRRPVVGRCRVPVTGSSRIGVRSPGSPASWSASWIACTRPHPASRPDRDSCGSPTG